MDIEIRQEQPDDYKETEEVVQTAFEQAEFSDQTEHLLVARIRASAAFIPELSLIAVDQENQQIVGHILLSKIHIVDVHRKVDSLALAPVSVLPAYQNRGVGKQLIEEALKRSKQLDYTSVIVLGHPAYYPKFGFNPAADFGIQAPFDVPNDAFMALELRENALSDVSGVVEYSDAFLQ